VSQQLGRNNSEMVRVLVQNGKMLIFLLASICRST